MNYEDYLKSKHWEEVARQRLKIDRYTCQFCGSHGTQTNPLEVHHFSYKNLGNENPWTDLVVLCDSCHQGITRMMNRVVSPDGKLGWTNKAIPRISTYTINGSLQEQRKEQLNESREMAK